MAFNWQTFRTRTITGVIFVAVMLAGLLWNQWSFLVLISILHFGCWWEYLKLTEKIQKTSFHIYTRFGLMIMGYGLMLWFCGDGWTIGGYGLKENFSLPFFVAGFILLLTGIFQKNPLKPKGFLMALAGIIYISLSWGLMIHLYRASDIHVYDTMFVMKGGFIPLVIFISIWSNDTMAYLVGSLIGKTPLTKISPKKTWEGTVGGILLACVIMYFFFLPVYLNKSDQGLNLGSLKIIIAITAFIASVSGLLGDLLESKLKRMAGVKDSGSLLPGHGGFLDRFDSLLFAIPFVWVFMLIIIAR
jgi:phosphatidate cytidylyltransferase